MVLYETQKLLIEKEIMNRMKRQPMEWEKTFKDHISNQ